MLLVAASVELLALGEEGVGFLNAAVGAGGFVGALFAMALVGRTRLAPSFTLGLILWGSPILLIGLLPSAVVAVVVSGGFCVMTVSGAVVSPGLTVHV